MLILNLYILYTLIILIGVVLIIAGVSYYIQVNKLAPQAKSSTEKTVAVLPFRNDSPDPDHEYLFNGMQDEITSRMPIPAKINENKFRFLVMTASLLKRTTQHRH